MEHEYEHKESSVYKILEGEKRQEIRKCYEYLGSIT